MNDWIVANINNPDFTSNDFKTIADMSLDNTQMLKREDYKKSEFIKSNPMFQNEQGLFSEDKFDKFYDLKLNEFLDFQVGDFPEGLELDLFDTDRTKDTKVKDLQLFLGKGVPNPDRQLVGIEGVNVWSTPEKSRAEIAQMSNIWDSEKGEYKNYSPNDKALFSGHKDYGFGYMSQLFSDPLVLAQYDEEGEHIDPITKLVVKHKKGDYKLNDEGTYYYETLNGRSPIGKEVLSNLDILTREGTDINKYDFFDSDDIEKSAQGVIAKNVASLIPIFIGGPVGTAYSTAIVAREMAKSLPMLYGMATGLFSDDEAPKWINTIAAMGDKFTSGTSDYAKQKTFSLENFGNLISDVALQWGQLKTIAHAIDLLRGSKNYIKEAEKNAKALYDIKKETMGALAAPKDELWRASDLGLACLLKYIPNAEKAAMKASELGRDASLAYMAIISNSDVFGDALLHGATKGEAAAVAFGSTLGMFGIDKLTGLGELFFDDATGDSVKAARRAIKRELFGYKDEKGVQHLGIQEVFNNVKKSNESTANKLLDYMKIASDKSKAILQGFSEDLQYHTTNFLGKALGEGLEEVSEELISDTAKSFYELASKFGLDTATTNIGAWDNALERYAMSFFGGALGGGIFYAKGALNGEYKLNKSDEELATLIRNGHANDLRNEINKLARKGKAGSTKLSAYDFERPSDGDNKVVWLTTQDLKKTQNLKIADIINLKITAIETVINNNQVNLSDDLLFEQMVLSSERLRRYKDISAVTNYYQDFNDVLLNLITAESNYNLAINTVEGTPKGTPIPNDVTASKVLKESDQNGERLENIQVLQKALLDARQKKNDFLSGDTSFDYTRKLNFAIDPQLHNLFIDFDPLKVWDKYFNKPLSEATKEDIDKFFTEILPKESNKAKLQLTKGWERFKDVEKAIGPEIANLAQQAPEFKKWADQFYKIIKDGYLDPNKLREKLISYDDKLDAESDEAYEFRNKRQISKLTGDLESKEEFDLRRSERQIAIDAINEELTKAWVLAFLELLKAVNYMVDPISKHLIDRTIEVRVKDVIKDKVDSKNLPTNIAELIKTLKNDLSNSKEVLDSVVKIETTAKVKDFMSLIDKLLSIKVYDTDGDPFDLLAEYLQGNLDLVEDGAIISDFLNYEGSNLSNLLQEKSLKELSEVLKDIARYVGEEQTMEDLFKSGKVAAKYYLLGKKAGFGEVLIINNLKENIGNDVKVVRNNVLRILLEVSANPIFGLQNTIKTSVKNPIVELIKSFAGKVIDGKKIPDVEEILNTIENKYQTINSTLELTIDDTLETLLEQVEDCIKLVSTYLYAASSSSTMNTPVGHNKTMNEFAKTHSDVILNWQELPEIDSDYAAIYQQLLAGFTDYLEYWRYLSNSNKINKRRQFEETDLAFSKSLWNLILKNIDNKSFGVDIDDKHYNLAEGIGSIDTSLVKTNKVLIPLFEAEKILYKNFQNALIDSELSVYQFLEKSGIIEKLLGNVSEIKSQESAELNSKLESKDFTKYDILQYFSQVFTLDPVVFYSKLKSKIKLDTKTAPITVLEYASKIAVASLNQNYKDIVKYAYDKSGDRSYLAANTTILPGVAGAGKTLVIARTISEYTEGNIIAVGPTLTLSKALLGALSLEKSYTIPELLNKLLGEDLFAKIKLEISKIKYNSEHSKYEGTSEYFDVWVENGLAKFKIKDNLELKFNKLEKEPKVLLIDEATHLNSIEVQILNEYMKSIKGLLVLLGDTHQNGYFNTSNALGNIRESDLFAIRTPRLTVSLRDNNVLKLANLMVVNSLLDLILHNVYHYTKEDLDKYWTVAGKLLSKLNFKVYNKEEINGDLITSKISDDLIKKIKKEGKTVGYIGDKSSASYAKLVDSKVPITALSINEVQGQEFDYVIIDTSFDTPKGPGIRSFLLNLYTLMSRGREAAIFIDNGLSNIIGKNEILNHKAKAPSLNDKINGKSAIDNLREIKLSIIDNFDLSPIELNKKSKKKKEDKKKEDKKPEAPKKEEETPKKEEAPKKENAKEEVDKEETPEELPKEETSDEEAEEEEEELEEEEDSDEEEPENPDADFVDPNSVEMNLEEKAFVDNLWEEEKNSNPSDENGSVEIDYESEDADFAVLTFGDVTYLGVKETKDVTRKGSSGKESTYPLWEIVKPSKGEPRRNLAALFDDGEEAFWKSSKENWQNQLFNVKSALIFGHTWDEKRLGTIDNIFPQAITNNFTREEWEKGTYEIEIRNTDNEVLPLFSPMPEVGKEYKGKKLIVNIVYKVKNKRGEDCIFDIAGLNYPETLNINKKAIIEKIDKKLKNKNISELLRKTLEDNRNHLEEYAKEYENLFDDWVNKFNKDGKFRLNVNNAVVVNKTSWFSKRPSPIRLGGLMDPSNMDGKPHYNNLQSMNPNKVFSDIYTYANSKDLAKIDVKLKGKAVIFWTSDTLLNPDELIKIYINLKEHPDTNKPIVRMLVLDNYGLSLGQLLDSDFLNNFSNKTENSRGHSKNKDDSEEKRKPVRLNFIGIQMFTSMWNFRASIINLKEAIEDFKKTYGYDQDKLNKILEVLQYLYDNKLDKEARETYLSNLEVTEEDINNLVKFNNEDCKNIPTLRLGYSKNGNGFYIQSFDIKGSTAYSNGKVNLLMITYDKLDLFQKLLDGIFGAILPSGSERVTLGINITKDEEGKEPWAESEYIDLKLAKHRRSLSNIVKYNKDTGLTILADGQLIAFPKGLYWSMVPMLINNILKTTTALLYNPDEIKADDLSFATLYLGEKLEDNELNKVSVLVGLWFSSTDPVLKVSTDPDSKEHPDPSLKDMLELIFHGTIENIHGVIKEGKKVKPLLLEDARFKEGFFINPDLHRRFDVTSNDNLLIVEEGLSITFYPIATSKELFTSNANLMGAGVSILLHKAKKLWLAYLNDEEIDKKLKEEREKTPELTPEQIFLKKFPEAYELIKDKRLNDTSLDYKENDILRAVDNENTNIFPNDVNLINYKSDYIKPDSLEIVFIQYKKGKDIKKFNLFNYVLLLLGKDKLDSLDIEGEYIIANVGKLKILFTKTEEGLTRVKEAEEKKEITVLDSKLDDGQTVRDALLDFTNTLSLNSDLVLEEFSITEQDIINFSNSVNGLTETDKENINDITTRIRNISELENFTAILTYMSDSLEELFSKLFENCF